MFGDNPAILQTMFQDLMQRLERVVPAFVFERKPAETTIPAPDLTGATESGYFQPWQLSWSPSDSLKGAAKMVFVLRVFNDFLERPYDHTTNPIGLWLDKERPGQPIGIFSLPIANGFTKSLAMKLVLYSCVRVGLTDDELILISPLIRALYSFRCVYKHHQSAKDARFSCLSEKMAEAARPRPDCVQVASVLQQTVGEMGKTWEEGCKELMAEFNAASGVECKRLTELEQGIVQLFPSLLPETQALIKYHWSNFEVKKSGLPYKLLGSQYVFQGVKARVDSDLWKAILAINNAKRHFYVARKIRYFTHKIADCQRLRKRVNLNTGSSQLRDPRDEETAMGLASIFAHFLPAWQQLLTKDQCQQLESKFCTGYLDIELMEKLRLATADLVPTSFRFLSEFGIKSKMEVTVDENEASKELQQAEIKQAVAKLQKEQQKFMQYHESLKDFKQAGLAMQAEVLDKQRHKQREAVTDFQECRFPLRDLLEVSHVSTFVESAINKYQNQQGMGGSPAFKVYYMNTQGLGYDALTGVQSAAKQFAGLVASDPRHCCLIVSCPTVGSWGNEYNVMDAQEMGARILECLRHPDQRFLCKEVTQMFDQASMPGQSQRPAAHKWFLCLSDQVDGNGNELMSIFAQSLLWKRQVLPCCSNSKPIPMNAHKNYVDPRRNFSTAKGMEADLSKPARRRQWLSGCNIPMAIMDGLFPGLPGQIDRSSLAVTWLDFILFSENLINRLVSHTHTNIIAYWVHGLRPWSTSLAMTTHAQREL